MEATKTYKLVDENGNPYLSQTPGTIGGYKKRKIYGRLDCPSALRHIAKGEYVKYRVFFADEETAKFIENAFRDGILKTTGTDIDKIMPPVPLFGKAKENRAEKKKGILDKLKGFFERFFGLA